MEKKVKKEMDTNKKSSDNININKDFKDITMFEKCVDKIYTSFINNTHFFNNISTKALSNLSKEMLEIGYKSWPISGEDDDTYDKTYEFDSNDIILIFTVNKNIYLCVSFIYNNESYKGYMLHPEKSGTDIIKLVKYISDNVESNIGAFIGNSRGFTEIRLDGLYKDRLPSFDTSNCLLLCSDVFRYITMAASAAFCRYIINRKSNNLFEKNIDRDFTIVNCNRSKLYQMIEHIADKGDIDINCIDAAIAIVERYLSGNCKYEEPKFETPVTNVYIKFTDYSVGLYSLTEDTVYNMKKEKISGIFNSSSFVIQIDDDPLIRIETCKYLYNKQWYEDLISALKYLKYMITN